MKIRSKKDALRLSAALVFTAGEFQLCLWDRMDNNCVVSAREINGEMYWVWEDTVNGEVEFEKIGEYDGMADMIWKHRKYINHSGQLVNRKEKCG